MIKTSLFVGIAVMGVTRLARVDTYDDFKQRQRDDRRDQASPYDATFFPGTYRRYCHLLGTNQAYVVTGVVEALWHYYAHGRPTSAALLARVRRDGRLSWGGHRSFPVIL